MNPLGTYFINQSHDPSMRRSEEKNTSAVPRLEKERLYTGYSLREHPVFSALVSSFTHIVLFTSWFHTRIHNRQSLKYYRLSKTSWKIHENITVRFNNKSQGFLLMPFESFKTRRLPILASTRSNSIGNACYAGCVLAGEQGPSCHSMKHIPNLKVIHVRFIKSLSTPDSRPIANDYESSSSRQQCFSEPVMPP